MTYRGLSDEALSAQCRWEAFHAPGPGGQRRDKKNTAVRATHKPTGLHAIGSESRSQRENRIHALKRLRLRLAIEIRLPIDRRSFVPPEWFTEARHLPKGAAPDRAPTLKITARHHAYFDAVALVLDVVTEMHGDIARAAAMLGVSRSSLGRFIEQDGQLVMAVKSLQA